MPVEHGHTIGGGFSPTYYSWVAMRTRVTNPRRYGAHRYIGRGIDCDPRWERFITFLADMGERPDGTSLERVNNDRGYWPDNCCWLDKTKQQRNTSRNKWVMLNGERMLFSEAATLLGRKTFSPTLLIRRKGFNHQQIIDFWCNDNSNIVWVTVDGVRMSLAAAHRQLGMYRSASHYYLRHGGFADHQAVIDFWIAKQAEKPADAA